MFVLGFAVGFSNSESQPIHCMADASEQPALSESPVGTGSAGNIAALTPAKFNTQGITGALNTNLNNKSIKCAVCHASRTEVVSTVTNSHKMICFKNNRQSSVKIYF